MRDSALEVLFEPARVLDDIRVSAGAVRAVLKPDCSLAGGRPLDPCIADTRLPLHVLFGFMGQAAVVQDDVRVTPCAIARVIDISWVVGAAQPRLSRRVGVLARQGSADLLLVYVQAQSRGKDHSQI